MQPIPLLQVKQSGFNVNISNGSKQNRFRALHGPLGSRAPFVEPEGAAPPGVAPPGAAPPNGSSVPKTSVSAPAVPLFAPAGLLLDPPIPALP
jgi:hypothetical protein